MGETMNSGVAGSRSFVAEVALGRPKIAEKQMETSIPQDLLHFILYIFDSRDFL